MENNNVLMLWMAQVICTAIRGTASAWPHERLEKILILFSHVMGQQIASSYAADEFSTLKLRKACKDAFAKAMNEEKVQVLDPVQEPNAASIGLTR